MSLTRRAFLHQTFVVGPVVLAIGIETDRAHAQGGPECTLPKPPPAQRFIPKEPKVVARLSAAEIGAPGKETQLQQFRDAIGLVRNLPEPDVIGWTKQIAQHCLNCAPTNTNNVHYNWQFPTWHRAYLYFLERILRTLNKTDDLRLVYWDWENPKSRVLPEIYAPTGQPLFWGTRGTLSPPSWPLPDSKVDVQPLLAIPDWTTFGGTAKQNAPRPAVYGGPHANVHNNFTPNGDMRNLQFSPRDPVFYAHHGNIDRLWTSWVKAGHTNPDFGDAKVYFYDETKTWRYILMNDLRDESKLGYRYSTLMTPKTPVKQLRQFALQKAGPRFKLPSGAKAKITAAAPTPYHLVIQNIRNLDKFPQATEFGVFLGSPAVGVEAESARGFLGRVAEIQSDGHAHTGPLSAALNVTGKLSSARDELDLTVAPLDDSGKTTAPAIPLVADKISLIG